MAESGLMLFDELQMGLAIQTIVIVLYTSGNGQCRCTLRRSCSESSSRHLSMIEDK